MKLTRAYSMLFSAISCTLSFGSLAWADNDSYTQNIPVTGLEGGPFTVTARVGPVGPPSVVPRMYAMDSGAPNMGGCNCPPALGAPMPPVAAQEIPPQPPKKPPDPKDNPWDPKNRTPDNDDLANVIGGLPGADKKKVKAALDGIDLKELFVPSGPGPLFPPPVFPPGPSGPGPGPSSGPTVTGPSSSGPSVVPPPPPPPNLVAQHGGWCGHRPAGPEGPETYVCNDGTVIVVTGGTQTPVDKIW